MRGRNTTRKTVFRGALLAGLALAIGGCYYAPAPYAYDPYYSGYYGGPYYGGYYGAPSVSFGYYGGGGGWHDHDGGHHWH